MADLESQIRLALELTGARTAGEAADQLERLGKEAGKTNAEIEEATRVFRYYEQILKGATAAEDESVQKAIDLAQSQRAVNQALEESSQVIPVAGAAAEAATGTGGLEDGKGGFAGLASTAFKAERVFTSMASGGGGLARSGPMLESVIGKLGGPAGLGFAIIGIEFALAKVVPLVEKLFSGGNAEAMKASAEYWERISKAAEKLAETKTSAEKKTAGEINEFIGESNAQVVQDAIRNSMLRTAEKTRTPEEQALMDVATPETGMTGAVAMHPMMALAAVQSRANIKETVKKQSDELFTQMATDPSARARVAQMAIDRPGEFPPGFAQSMAGFTPEATEAADKEMAETVAFGERAHDAGVRRREHAKKVNRENKAADTLTEQGRHLEQQMNRERERQKDRDNAETKRLVEQTQAYSDQLGEAMIRDQAKATHKAEHAASLPGRVQAEHQFIGQQVSALDRANQQQGGPAATPGFLQHVTQQAIANVDTGQTLANAIRNAVRQTQEKIEADAARHLNQMSKQMDASQGHTATLFGRGSG